MKERKETITSSQRLDTDKLNDIGDSCIRESDSERGSERGSEAGYLRETLSRLNTDGHTDHCAAELE